MPWSTRGAGWEVLVGRAAMGPLPWLFTVVAVGCALLFRFEDLCDRPKKGWLSRVRFVAVVLHLVVGGLSGIE